jgi:hypothetical protein
VLNEYAFWLNAGMAAEAVTANVCQIRANGRLRFTIERKARKMFKGIRFIAACFCFATFGSITAGRAVSAAKANPPNQFRDPLRKPLLPSDD